MIGLARVALQPVTAAVKVKFTVPTAAGETKPSLETAAIDKLDEAQLPPDVGVRFKVLPIQTLLDEADTMGLALIVMAELASDTQPVVELVKVNAADPAAIPVMRPALLMLATPGAELVQVPPEVGVMVVVAPTQRLDDKGCVMVGLLLTTIVTSLLSRPHILPVSFV